MEVPLFTDLGGIDRDDWRTEHELGIEGVRKLEWAFGRPVRQ